MLTGSRARKQLLIILLVSVLLLVGGGVLRKSKPELYLKEKAVTPEELAQERYKLLDELPLKQIDPKTLQPNEKQVIAWPESSSVPDFHKTDLSIYRGRVRNEKALEGITIFLDVGEPEVLTKKNEAKPQETKDPKAGLKPAATDPNTGRLLPRYQQQIEEEDEEEEEESTAPPEVLVAKEKILPNVAQFLQAKLEDLGAKVILTRSITQTETEISQASSVGALMVEKFLKELNEQRFRCEPLKELLPVLQRGVSNPAEEAVTKLFSERGVSSQLRLVLDVERQYADALLLSLRYDQGEKDESGCRVRYMGDSVSSSLGATQYSDSAVGDQPAYLNYGTTARRELAEELERTIRSLLPEFIYKGKKRGVMEENVTLGRLCGLQAVELVVGNESNEANIKALAREEAQKNLAEAIATACYQFYCH